jgi:hypothetical protein
MFCGTKQDIVTGMNYSDRVNSSIIQAMPQLTWSVAIIPTQQSQFNPRSGHVEFVVEKEAQKQVSSEYFSFPCQFSFQ